MFLPGFYSSQKVAQSWFKSHTKLEVNATLNIFRWRRCWSLQLVPKQNQLILWFWNISGILFWAQEHLFCQFLFSFSLFYLFFLSDFGRPTWCEQRCWRKCSLIYAELLSMQQRSGRLSSPSRSRRKNSILVVSSAHLLVLPPLAGILLKK